jgi:hypothetical protein
MCAWAVRKHQDAHGASTLASASSLPLFLFARMRWAGQQFEVVVKLRCPQNQARADND